MRKIFCALLCIGSFYTYCYEPVHGVFVVDSDNENIIYSYNADKQTQPASLTKMMTLLLTFKELQKGTIKWDTMIKISRHAADQQPSKLGIKAGSSISVRSAVMSLITKSANDIAVALAEHIGGTEENFVKKMNAEKKRLGMTSTLFVNPSGWKNTKQHTTARDMFKLSKALLREYSKYYSLFSTKVFNYKKQNLANHNNLLGRHRIGTSANYFVVDGIKTGYVAASGFNLAASATNGKVRLIAVILGGKTARQRDNQMNLLLQKGFLRAEAKLKDKSKNKSFGKANDAYVAYLEQIGSNAFDNVAPQSPISLQKASNRTSKQHMMLITQKNAKLQKNLFNKLNKNRQKKNKRK